MRLTFCKSLKTHVEKMSVFSLSTMLMKTNKLSQSLHDVDENKWLNDTGRFRAPSVGGLSRMSTLSALVRTPPALLLVPQCRPLAQRREDVLHVCRNLVGEFREHAHNHPVRRFEILIRRTRSTGGPGPASPCGDRRRES